MTSAIPQTAQHPFSSLPASTAASGTTSPSPGAVPAQSSARSYATATKTASPAPPPPAGASTHNAKSTASPVNGSNPMAQGGSGPNGTSAHADHARKPSVVINASGASGYISNGGPVAQSSRPAINFGSLNAQGSPLPQPTVPHQPQTSSLPAPPRDPRATSPAHSPSPIPQPQASGGRPPSSLQAPSNGLAFGSMPGDADQSRQGQAPLGPGYPTMHERRTSSQSMHGDHANMQNMNRNNFAPTAPNGRGRGLTPQPYGLSSPAQNYRPLPNQPRSGMAPQFQQQIPGSPYGRGRNSPAPSHAQMQYPGQNYGYPHQMANVPHFDPNSGYYPQYPYYPQQYSGQQPPASPRPYPSPFGGPPGQMQPPYGPPAEAMTRGESNHSNQGRPSSAIGQPQPTTPSLGHLQSHTPVQSQQTPASSSSAFVRPKKTSAIKITDANGNAINFSKPSPSPSTSNQPTTPVIVSTPNAPTPPPRAASGQQTRAEPKSAKSAEETKNAFQEQVRRSMEDKKRKEDEEAATKSKALSDKADETEKAEKAEQAAKVEQAEKAEKVERAAKAQEAEKAAQVEKSAKEQAEKDAAQAESKKREDAEKKAAADKQKAQEDQKAEQDAADASKAKEADETAKASVATAAKEVADKKPAEETDDERMEREIAEWEAEEVAKEKLEAERESAYQEKKKKRDEDAAKAKAGETDEDLKRQEREAEAREEAKERERAQEEDGEKDTSEEPDEEAKALFASLKKPAIGPGASASEGDHESAAPEDTSTESAAMPPPQQPEAGQAKLAGAQKAKPTPLKLETNKRVEPAEPTPGMQALKSARFLDLKEEAKYPDGLKSPNPALNQAGARKGRAYDKDFLLQFQKVFNEKPSVDWDRKVKETLGSGDDARAQSARTPSSMGARSASGRPGNQAMQTNFGGPMGAFGNQPARTLPPGTTSDSRFQAANAGMGAGGRAPLPAQVARMPSNLGMGTPGAGIIRNTSSMAMGNMGPNSPRQASARGGKPGGSKRGDRIMSRKEEAEAANKMPLTANMDLKPLEKSTTGWKPPSVAGPVASHSAPDPSGNMAPDMVQRKVKAALNKMTPEKFDKISDQVLEIAGQSKNEPDGRTLRQVIQLTFEKACDEAHWAGMYAKFCHKMLTTMSNDVRDETIRDNKTGEAVAGGALFRKYLLNRCQEEFERGWQANLPDKPEGETQEAALLSDEYYVAAAAKRRGLGLIQFIGQLYTLRMLTIRIMHQCVLRLLDFEGDPDEIAVENLTTLLRAVGGTMSGDENGRTLLDQYFERINGALLKSSTLASRPRFMIMDLVDLRNKGWRGKDDAKGPKTLDQIHADAAAAQAKAEMERARAPQRGGHGGGRMQAGRGDARNFSGNMPPPVDYNRTTVGMDDLRRLQNRGTSGRTAGGAGGLGPGGSLGPGSSLGARAGSKRGLGPPSSGNTTRTNTPPVEKKDAPPTQQNAFSALASLDPESAEDPMSNEQASPPAARNRSKSPLPAEKAE